MKLDTTYTIKAYMHRLQAKIEATERTLLDLKARRDAMEKATSPTLEEVYQNMSKHIEHSIKSDRKYPISFDENGYPETFATGRIVVIRIKKGFFFNDMSIKAIEQAVTNIYKEKLKTPDYVEVIKEY